MLDLVKKFLLGLILITNIANIAQGADPQNNKEEYISQEFNSNYYHSYHLEDACMEYDDPYEKVNRKIFQLNSVLDFFLLRPVAKIYSRFLNDYAQARIDDFVDNIGNTPITFLSYALQLKLENTLLTFWKFTFNTIFGLGGFHDFAKMNGLEVEPQTFGSMLARYGVTPGPYIMLPIFGSTTARDMFDNILPLNLLTGRLNSRQRSGIRLISMVHKRSELLPFTDSIMDNPDPYALIRNNYFQINEKKMDYPKSIKKVCTPEFYNKNSDK